MKPRPKLKAAVQKRRAARKQRLSETSAEMKKKARERVAKWRAEQKQKRKEKMVPNEKEKETKKETKEDKKEDVLPMPEPTKVFKGDGITPDLTGTDKDPNAPPVEKEKKK